MNDVRDLIERLVDTPLRSDPHRVFEQALLDAERVRRRRTQRRVAALSGAALFVAVAAVFAIRGQSDRHGLTVEATATSSTHPSTRPTQYEVDALVEQSKRAAPILCITTIPRALPGFVGPSHVNGPPPPACDGPPISGWDWTGLTGTQTSGHNIWGDFHVVGTYDGKTFTLTRQPVATQLGGPVPPVLITTPCPAPKGGWVVTNPSRLTLTGFTAVDAAANAQPDLAGIWNDNTTPVNGHVAALKNGL